MDINNFISKRANLVDGSAIRKANEYAANIKNPINLTIGQPDFDVAPQIKEALLTAINNKKNGYCKTAGIDELRSSILSKKGAGKKDVVITSGVTGAISLALMTCLDCKDELLIPDPYFLQYAEIVKLLGINPVYINTYPDFTISIEKIKNKITRKTKAIILNYPNNPTGCLMKPEELGKIITYLNEQNIIVIFDEIYSDFNYTSQKNINPFDYGDNIILLNGYSKSYGMTGWRLGYAITHPKIIERMTRLQGQLYVSAPSIVQYAALVADTVDLNPIIDVYKRRNLLVKEMLSSKFGLSDSNGGFYFFIKVPERMNCSATDFCKIAADNRVLLVPGKAFSQQDTHFRISICVDDEKLKAGLEILNEIVTI